MASLEHSLILEKNEKLSMDVHVLTFATQDIPRTIPGQFFQLKTPFFLRRPIGVMQQNESSISFGVRIVGKGTAALGKMQPGDQLSALGPLGRGFNFRHLSKKDSLVLVGGGTGIFPLFYLAKSLQEDSYQQDVCQIYGFRSPEESYLIDEIRNLSTKSILSSDAGGLDFQGHSAAALDAFLNETKEKPRVIFSCGPEAMLKAVIEIGKNRGISVQASLETRMGCGIGLCRGCSVDLIDEKEQAGFRRVRCCKEGPVFPGEKIIWR